MSPAELASGRRRRPLAIAAALALLAVCVAAVAHWRRVAEAAAVTAMVAAAIAGVAVGLRAGRTRVPQGSQLARARGATPGSRAWGRAIAARLGP